MLITKLSTGIPFEGSTAHVVGSIDVAPINTYLYLVALQVEGLRTLTWAPVDIFKCLPT